MIRRLSQPLFSNHDALSQFPVLLIVHKLVVVALLEGGEELLGEVGTYDEDA